MLNFLIATAILTMLNNWAVMPLSRFFLSRRLRELTASPQLIDSAGEVGAPGPEQTIRFANQSYLHASLMVMILAGMVAGLLGFRFVGFSLSRRGWPGMLAFCATSFVFAGLYGLF